MTTKITRTLALLALGFGGLATAQSWDTTGNQLLNGTYYFRHVVWIPNSNNLSLRDAASFNGIISFDGNGNYTVSATAFDSIARTPQAYQTTGTYSIAASGNGFLSSPASGFLTSVLGAANTDSIYGLVAQGIFIGSSTENQAGYSDLFIAMPAGSSPPTNASFTGTYALADLDHPTGNPLDARNSLIHLTAGGDGNLTNVSATAYLGGSVSPVTQSIQNMQYSASNTGLVIDSRGFLADSILTPKAYTLHISADGSFVFGGAPDGWDMLVGVQAASSGTPNFSSIYYQAGLDADLSQLANGVSNTASYFGSLDALPSGNQGLVLEHQRRTSNTRGVYDYTFDDAYLFNADATYDDALLSRHYIFSSNGAIRIGVGTGSSLGISVALQSPASTGTGVYIDPRGITNSGSTALFTSRIAPGELLTIYGTSGSTFAPQFLYDPTFPFTLGGVQVRINNRLAPLLTLDPASNSITLEVPYETTEPIASIQLSYNGVQSNIVTVFTSATATGVLTRPPGGVSYAAARRASDSSIINPSNPARIGEYVSVYLTGLGAVNPPLGDNTPAVSTEPLNRATHDFRVFIDGVQAPHPLAYVGMTPTVVGLGVINVLIPDGISTGEDVKVDVQGPDAYTSQALLSISPETGTAIVTATAGGEQTTAVNTPFAANLVATVRDAGGSPLSGVTVNFTVVGSGAGGTFAGGIASATTNVVGVAAAPALTANGIAGNFKVVASAQGARSAIFNLTNTPRTAASITATGGTPQSAPINTSFAAPLVATVKDANGLPVSGVVVTFAAPGIGASGSFAAGNRAVTDASGAATANGFTANGLQGAYTVTATVAGVATPASFALTNGSGNPSVISATGGTPQSTAISTLFVQPLVATVKDSQGNPVSGLTVTFTAPSSGASGTFAGGLNTAVTNAAGVAISAAFTANATAGSYTVTASASGVSTPASFSLTNTSGTTPTITATGGTPQTAAINAAFAAPLVATVKNSSGNPLSGATVTFTAPNGGASGTFAGGANTAVTNASGVATSAVFTANGTAGSYTVAASAPGVAAPASFLLTNTSGTTSTITPTGGTPQTATINTAFTARLVATVKDSGGNPASGQIVTFTAPTSGASGTFAGGATTATTNAAGVATSAVFTANAIAGGYTVAATVPGLLTPANFSLTNTAGDPSSISATGGTPQSTGVSTTFAARLAATVKDAGGNGIGGLTVTFTAPSAGASGTFAGGVITATTNASGVATSAAFTANANPGGYTVTATVAGVSTSASFSLTNTTGTASSIVTTSGTPQSTVISTAFAAPLVATVKDSNGSPVSGVIVTFTVPTTGASGIFAGGTSTSATNASGIATSAVLTANGTAGTFTVVATVAGVATPANFALTNLAGSAASITATTGTPQSTSINTAFAARLAATVKDSGGNPLSGLTVTFTAPSSGASGTFTNATNTAVTNAAGVATSELFTANATAGSYTVTAAVAGVATPASFALTNSLTPSSIAATGGTPQTAIAGAAFGAPLAATVKDAGNNPVSGVVVTFTAPVSGASGTFTGGVNTATTNALGVATSAVFTANAIAGSYNVAASVSGVAAPANFALTNTSAPNITLTGTSVGQNLEAAIGLSLSQPAPAGNTPPNTPPGLPVTLTSSDPTKVLLAGRPGDAGTASLVITVPLGQSNIGGIFVQALASSGTVTVTASAANFIDGTSTVTLTPSGFTLAGPAGVGAAFSANQGSNTSLTVSSVQLDSGLNVIQGQQVRGGFPVQIPVTSLSTAVGTITNSPILFNGGDNTATAQFNAVGAGQTTLTAGVPSGFNAPTQGSSLIATVNPLSLNAGNVTVGKNLVNSTQVGIGGSIPPAGLTMTVTSNNSSLMLLSKTAGGAGSASITLTVPQFAASSPAFYVQGLSDSGTVTYTASMPGFASGTGTVTLAPSGFVIAGPTGLSQTSFSTTTTSTNSTITVYSALLDSALNYVAQMPVQAGASVTVTSTSPAVGTITTSPVIISPGATSATTQFQPLSPGSTSLTLTQPSGFSTPSQFSSVTANVIIPGIAVSGGALGFNLETVGTVTLGSVAGPGGLDVALVSNSAPLLLSTNGVGVGSGSITVHIAAGSNNGTYYLQSTSGTGTATYTATVPGFGSGTGTITFTPSGAVVAGALGLNIPFFLAPVSGGPVPITVYMAQLDPVTHAVGALQALAGGQTVSVSLTSSPGNNPPGSGTIASPVTINGGPLTENGVSTQFTPITQGNVTVSVATPSGYTTATTNTSLMGIIGN